MRLLARSVAGLVWLAVVGCGCLDRRPHPHPLGRARSQSFRLRRQDARERRLALGGTGRRGSRGFRMALPRSAWRFGWRRGGPLVSRLHPQRDDAAPGLRACVRARLARRDPAGAGAPVLTTALEWLPALAGAETVLGQCRLLERSRRCLAAPTVVSSAICGSRRPACPARAWA